MFKKTPDDKSENPRQNDISQEKKLIKATELPIHGNPFPTKNVNAEEAPGVLETKVRSVRTMLQPYISPLASAYEKTSDIMSIGVNHSQSTMSRVAENLNPVSKALIISVSGLLGIGLARKRGILKKLLCGSVFFGGAMIACYPKDCEEKAHVLWYIANNKLPVLAKQQYEKMFSKKDSADVNKIDAKDDK